VDIIATNLPQAVANPHGRNSFAVEDGSATQDPDFPKRASVVDVERSESIAESERYPVPTEEEASVLRKVSDSIPSNVASP
jgi:hypothetical protein